MADTDPAYHDLSDLQFEMLRRIDRLEADRLSKIKGDMIPRNVFDEILKHKVADESERATMVDALLKELKQEHGDQLLTTKYQDPGTAVLAVIAANSVSLVAQQSFGCGNDLPVVGTAPLVDFRNIPRINAKTFPGRRTRRSIVLIAPELFAFFFGVTRGIVLATTDSRGRIDVSPDRLQQRYAELPIRAAVMDPMLAAYGAEPPVDIPTLSDEQQAVEWQLLRSAETFVIAHEMGHACLHHSGAAVSDGSGMGEIEGELRETWAHELEADYFGATLLQAVNRRRSRDSDLHLAAWAPTLALTILELGENVDLALHNDIVQQRFSEPTDNSSEFTIDCLSRMDGSNRTSVHDCAAEVAQRAIRADAAMDHPPFWIRHAFVEHAIHRDPNSSVPIGKAARAMIGYAWAEFIRAVQESRKESIAPQGGQAASQE